MDQFVSKLADKLDKLDERLDSIDKTLAVNTVHLGEHIRRTELLEGRTDRLESETAPLRSIRAVSIIIIKTAAVVGSVYAILEALRNVHS